MSGRRLSRSVFDRLGDKLEDDDRRDLCNLAGSNRNEESLIGREYDTIRDHYLELTHQVGESSSRKRHHFQLEDGEIDDNAHLGDGVPDSKRHRERHKVELFNNTRTPYGWHSLRTRERKEQIERRQTESPRRREQLDLPSYNKGDRRKTELTGESRRECSVEYLKDTRSNRVGHWRGKGDSKDRSQRRQTESTHSQEQDSSSYPKYARRQEDLVDDESSTERLREFHGHNERKVEDIPGCSFWREKQRGEGVDSRVDSRYVTTQHERKSTSSSAPLISGSSHHMKEPKNKRTKQEDTYREDTYRIQSKLGPYSDSHIQRTLMKSRQASMSTSCNRAKKRFMAISSQAALQKTNRGGTLQGGMGGRGSHRDTRRESKSQDQIKEQAVGDLRRLTLQDSGRDIAIWLATRPDALKTIVEMSEMNRDEMETLLRVLANACTESTHFEGLLKLVLPVVADSGFFTKHLLEWIMKARFSAETETVVSDICTVCFSILQKFPSKVVHIAHVVGLLYANYDSQIKIKEKELTEEKLIRIRDLNSDCNETLREIQNLQAHQSINQFRKMSIIPELDEIRINFKPTLNPNLKQGAYENVDTYLDTQFRLLREDFVAPLRVGICSFIKQQQTGNAGKRVDDVRVYHSVHILHPICGRDGVSYRIQFSLRGWNHRRLANNKLLRYGSLVCLSPDGFETIHFGIVTNRDSLTDGIVEIQFQEPVTVGSIYNHEYIMAESEAFFEAYRPVLKGLQQITEQTLPLQNYIIKTSHEVSPPLYLRDAQNAKYDLWSLFKPECVVQMLCRLSKKRRLSKKHPQSTLNMSSCWSKFPYSPANAPTSPSYSPTSPSYSPTSPSYFPDCKKENEQINHSFPEVQFSAGQLEPKVYAEKTEKKEAKALGKSSTISEKVRTFDETSTNGMMEVTTLGETSTNGMMEVTALGETSTNGMMEVTALGETSTNGMTEVTALGETSTNGMTEVTALGETSTISEKEVTALGETSTNGMMEVAALGETSTISETEVTALGETSTNGMTEVTALGETSTNGMTEVTALGETSTIREKEVTALGETSTNGMMEVAALGETSTNGMMEVTALGETSTNGMMEVTALGETSTNGMTEVAALGETSTIREKEVTAFDETSTVGVMNVTSLDETSTVSEKEITALDETSTIGDKEFPALEETNPGARTSDDSCLSDPSEIPLLRFAKWPDDIAVCLDESQRRAVYSALTQELAVIQGPPGTGKTYVGLKIMQVLLNKHNCKVWSRENARGPILVVCYTNHALDQFLEGVLAFETNIVRIGSRSKSQRLDMCNLKHVKQGHRPGREKIRFFNLRDEAKSAIEYKVRKAFSFKEEIVGFENLECVIMRSHIRSLHNRASKGVDIISQWLELEYFMENRSGTYAFQKDVIGNVAGKMALGETGITDDRMLDDELESRPDFAQNKSANVLQECRKNAAEREDDDSTKQNKLKALKFIEEQMHSSDKMSQNEANGFEDIWDLHIGDKWRLYRYWVDAYRSHCLASTTEHIYHYNGYTQAVKEIENNEVCQILSDAKVIGMTTTGAAKWQSVLQRVGPRIVVVEEAAEVMEAHVITTLSKHCQHLILIGDHQQLKPNPAVYRLAKQYNLDISLFERMVNNNFPCQMLTSQHRMRPEIAEIMRNHFYKELQDDVSVLHMENVRGVSKNIFFINHEYIEDSSDDGMKSHSSKHEADMTVALCKYLLQQGYSPSQVTILTVYTGQLLSIKSRLTDLQVNGVRTCVVDNFQGEECDIVLLSLVRSNDEGNIGFLRTHNRICVMLSRAKLGLFCIGNFEQLAAHSDKWKSITDEMRQKELLGNNLVLACSVHPGVETKVACAADFKRVPEGGCIHPCVFRLSCGHVCTRLCHPDDRSHERFMCDKPCERVVCEANHRCPNKCGEKCQKICDRPVKKQLPGCSHLATMKCSNNPDYIQCDEKCAEKLPCGHACRNTCGKPCQNKPCVEKVLRTDLPCGHQEFMPCSDNAAECPALCRKLLACGHKCPGKCSSCLGGRLHVSCRQKCDRILVCGHTCRQPCASNCPPCDEKCENQCIHSKCQKKCWEPCAPCQEPCSWRCRHHKCAKKCSEPCNRPPCDRPCNKRLNDCEHRCIGMCGEPCPSKCRVCNQQEVTEIFFGTEDEDDTYFVELRDCGHIIDVSCLDKWMKQDDNPSPDPAAGDDQVMPEDETSTVSVHVKSCPKCKTPIRRSTRYGGIINGMLADIERVKGQVIGDSNQIAQRKQEIRSMLSKVKESNHFAKIEAATKAMRSKTSSLYDLNLLLNQTNFATEIVKLKKQLSHDLQESRWYKTTCSEMSKVTGRLFNSSRPFRGTEQELLDFPNELKRLHLCCEACDILKTGGLRHSQNKDEDLQCQMDKVYELLFCGKPLTADSEKEVTELLKKLRKSVGGLGISNETRVMIVKAIGLSKGHWYKCPNGHVYAIGECGGAMQKGVCPECKTEIGGGSHQLASGNAVASEMDGAPFAAWSEQANMANYDLQNIHDLD